MCRSKILIQKGLQYGRLVIVKELDQTKHGMRTFLCECECGNMRKVCLGSLRSGKTKSCGCYNNDLLTQRNKTHNMSRTLEYNTYKGMKDRCCNKEAINYPRYGGRGVAVCSRWLESFQNFYDDMGDRPAGMTLDRINNSSGYCKKNCQWKTVKEQNNNRRDNHHLTYDGDTLTIAQWAEKLNLKPNVITLRINRLGWNTEKALTTPVRKNIRR